MGRHKVIRSPRLVRKQRETQKNKALAIAALAVVVASGLIYALSLPRLLIQHIAVEGDSTVPAALILETVQEFTSGRVAFVFPKASALFFPRKSAEQALLRKFPHLESADISTEKLASVRVAVSGRQGVALWCAPMFAHLVEPCFSIDKTGFVFEAAPETMSFLYPRIIDRTASSSELIGEAVTGELPLARLLSLFRRLEQQSVEVESLEILPGADIALNLRTGGRILMRDDGEFGTELERLRALLSEKDLVPRAGTSLEVEYIDLRYGNKIYFKPR